MESYQRPGESFPSIREQQEYMAWRSRQATLRQVKRTSCFFALAFLLEAFLLYLVFNIMSVAGTYLETLIPVGGESFWEIIDGVFGVVCYLTAFLLPYLLYARFVGYSLRKIPQARPYAPISVASIGLWMGISLLGSFVTRGVFIFFSSLGLTPHGSPGYPGNFFALILNLVTTLILAPIIEEIIYRGIVMGSLRRFGDAFAIIMSSLLFGLAHGNILQLPYSFVLGLLMGYIVIKTNSLYGSIIIHFINNLVATLQDYFMSGLPDAVYSLLDGTINLIYIIGFIIAAMYLCRRKVSWGLSPVENQESIGFLTRHFFTTVPMVIVVGIIIFQIFTDLI